jgi:hypothetical protein
MTKLRVLLGLVAIVVIAGAVFIGSSSNTAVAKKAPPVQFGFSATFVEVENADGTVTGIPPAEVLTNTVLSAGKIGSSGQDGVYSYQIDSFFDITYRLFGDPDFDFVRTGTIDIEIVALNLTSADPVAVIDAVGRELSGKGKMTDYRGHVTVLK